MLPPALFNAVVILVTLVWLANLIAPLVSPYTLDPDLNLVFMCIVGGAIALRHPPDRLEKRR